MSFLFLFLAFSTPTQFFFLRPWKGSYGRKILKLTKTMKRSRELQIHISSLVNKGRRHSQNDLSIFEKSLKNWNSISSFSNRLYSYIKSRNDPIQQLLARSETTFSNSLIQRLSKRWNILSSEFNRGTCVPKYTLICYYCISLLRGLQNI